MPIHLAWPQATGTLNLYYRATPAAFHTSLTVDVRSEKTTVGRAGVLVGGRSVRSCSGAYPRLTQLERRRAGHSNQRPKAKKSWKVVPLSFNRSFCWIRIVLAGTVR